MIRMYINLGTQVELMWEGDLEFVPRVGEYVVLKPKKGDLRTYRVDQLQHFPMSGNVKVYLR